MLQSRVPATKSKMGSQLSGGVLLFILVATITAPAQPHPSFDVIAIRGVERHYLLRSCSSGDQAIFDNLEAAGFQKWPHSSAGALFSRETF